MCVWFSLGWCVSSAPRQPVPIRIFQGRPAPFPTAIFVSELDDTEAVKHFPFTGRCCNAKCSDVALTPSVLLGGFSRSIGHPNSSKWLGGSVFPRKSSPKEMSTHQCPIQIHDSSVFFIPVDVAFSTVPQVDVQAIPSMPPTNAIPDEDICATEAIRSTEPCVQPPSAKVCFAADHRLRMECANQHSLANLHQLLLVGWLHCQPVPRG